MGKNSKNRHSNSSSNSNSSRNNRGGNDSSNTNDTASVVSSSSSTAKKASNNKNKSSILQQGGGNTKQSSSSSKSSSSTPTTANDPSRQTVGTDRNSHDGNNATTTTPTTTPSSLLSRPTMRAKIRIMAWWVIGCSILAFVCGFGLGSGILADIISTSSTNTNINNNNPNLPSQWKIRLGQRIRQSFLYKLMYPEHLRRKQLQAYHRRQQKRLRKQKQREEKQRQRQRQEGGEGSNSDPTTTMDGLEDGSSSNAGTSYYSGGLHTETNENYVFDDDEDDDDDDVLLDYPDARVPSRLELYTIGVIATLIEWSGLFNFTEYAIQEHQKERELKQYYMQQQHQQQQQQQQQENEEQEKLGVGEAIMEYYKQLQEQQEQQLLHDEELSKANKEFQAMDQALKEIRSKQKKQSSSQQKSRDPLFGSSSSSSSSSSSVIREYDDAITVTNFAPPTESKNFDIHIQPLRKNPSHPFVYAVLREAIIREKGGYVHYDLGILEPAPCGAARGIGMVRNNYGKCQKHCIPGISSEKLEYKERNQTTNQATDTDTSTPKEDRTYFQEEVLIKVPLSYQMTRKVALNTLLPRIPAEIQAKFSLHELDDFVLLTLLLAHERGLSNYSRWLPYIASLPLEPSCGYTASQRPYKLDAMNVLKYEHELDVNGWENELKKAEQNADRIVSALDKNYGSSIAHPAGISSKENLAWALCQVASRAVGGTPKWGTLRLIPLLDMVNHDFDAGGFVELTGQERLKEGNFVDAMGETDEGAFVLRSLRHGRRRALRVGQELLVNYNVPHYSALDWFVNTGFVPREKFIPWRRLVPPLPRIRRDGPFADSFHDPSSTSGRHVIFEG